ncbi:cytochrome P450 [Paracoccus sp. S3-43]|uniref:cytochrome P450 n=1 Tax=Paracoccus sp. S3-43 TaxID=3030011 RepID=UPI0023B1EAB8|nr:cytochrome P450 [Paracoccus sp. S3-43]WEF23296.1 cytochrome P450 [Paracoccus sp. S3-43]
MVRSRRLRPPAAGPAPKTRASARDAFIPFSAGERACPGAGLAMIEGVVMLARIAAASACPA